jgi:hypothetical protein
MESTTMSKFLRCRLPASLAALVLLAGCGSVSGLTREAANAPARIADFDRVEVLDFSASDSQVFDDATKQAAHLVDVNQARREFADKIAEAITATGAFNDVSRQPGTGPALRVSGDISRYDEGNVVARGLTGFAGQTHFDATVNITDSSSGQVLATLNIERNSWPLPVGASMSTLQTTNYFMNNAAKKIADELAAKKKVQ